MSLRKGNVAANPAAAAAPSPPLDTETGPAVVPPAAAAPPPPPVAAAPPPPPVAAAPVATAPPAAATTAPVHQEQAAAAEVAQVAPAAAAPVVAADAPVQLPAVTSPVQTSGVQANLEQAGFAGLEFGFGSFPIITLQNSMQFESSEGGVLGQSFNCILLSSVPKYICKNDQKGTAEDFFYSYDREYSTGGEPAAQVIAGWNNRGWKHEWKKYLDVQAQLVSDDPEDNGALVLLSVPPTSVSRFSGYVATLLGRHGKELSKVVTRCSVGEKITKVKFPFCPWVFDYLSDV